MVVEERMGADTEAEAEGAECLALTLTTSPSSRLKALLVKTLHNCSRKGNSVHATNGSLHHNASQTTHFPFTSLTLCLSFILPTNIHVN